MEGEGYSSPRTPYNSSQTLSVRCSIIAIMVAYCLLWLNGQDVFVVIPLLLPDLLQVHL